MRLWISIASGLVAGLAVVANAAAQDATLDQAARARALDGLLRILEENYVLPDIAWEIGRSVRERDEQGAYDGLDGPGLARALTRDLGAISHDRHLRVEYSAESDGTVRWAVANEQRVAASIERVALRFQLRTRGRVRVFRHGYQSWSATGVATLGADTPAGRRMIESVEFFEFVQAELPALIERWRAKRASGS